MYRIHRHLAAIVLLTCLSLHGAPPNIVIIMTDDMGYSDLGCYGSEISTPNLDALAGEGVRFTQFYNTGRCCPTRASLLTGLYPHQAGMGHMTGDYGEQNPGYRGRLLNRSVTLAEVLGPAGYHTFHTGKWHVGAKEEAWWPRGRGFERCFSVPAGGGFYFKLKSDRTIVRDDKVVHTAQNDVPKDWYATDAWTDEGLTFIDEAVQAKRPFLWYLAYNAPHWPLQAKPEDIAKYRGRYKAGWDAVRQARYEKMIELGLVNGKWPLSPRPAAIPAWDSLSDAQKDTQDLRMATYAAMIDNVDQNIGKMVRHLKKTGVYDNTLILFLQDNGGCAEGGTLGSNSGKGECGTAESFAKYGACWANASNTPFRRYKHYVHEGGAATPLVAHWPQGIARALHGKLVTQPTHVIDLMATCVDLSGATYPEKHKGTEIVPMQGRSLRPLFEGKPFSRGDAIYFEHEGNRGVRLGQWKLVALKGKSWELYDMATDRTELNDLAATSPERAKQMAAMWEAWAARSYVNRVGGKKKKKNKK